MRFVGDTVLLGIETLLAMRLVCLQRTFGQGHRYILVSAESNLEPFQQQLELSAPPSPPALATPALTLAATLVDVPVAISPIAPTESKRWILESLFFLAAHLGVTLPPLPSIFTIASTSRGRVNEESGDDSEETTRVESE